MALRHTRRNRVLVDEGVSPIYREMLRTYTQNLSVEYAEVKLGKNGVADRAAFAEALDTNVGALVLQNPNFFGCLDQLSDVIEQAHSVGALAVVSVYPMALSHVETPGAMGADIVTGEDRVSVCRSTLVALFRLFCRVKNWCVRCRVESWVRRQMHKDDGAMCLPCRRASNIFAERRPHRTYAVMFRYVPCARSSIFPW